jgi:hypothetical protein
MDTEDAERAAALFQGRRWRGPLASRALRWSTAPGRAHLAGGAAGRQRPVPDMRPVSAQEMRAALADEPDLLLVRKMLRTDPGAGGRAIGHAHPSRCEGGPERPLGALPRVNLWPVSIS